MINILNFLKMIDKCMRLKMKGNPQATWEVYLNERLLTQCSIVLTAMLSDSIMHTPLRFNREKLISMTRRLEI